MQLRKIMAGIAASAVAVTSLVAVASAQSYDGGIYKLTDVKNHFIKDSNAALLSIAADHVDEIASYGGYVPMDVAGDGPADDSEEAILAVVEQNRDLWSQVEKVEVKFTVDISDCDKQYNEEHPEGDDLALDYTGFFCQGYVQLGNGAGWNFQSGTDVAAITTLDGTALEDTEEGYMVLGQEYLLTMYPAKMIELYGTDAADSGVLAMGLQVGNNGMQWRDEEGLYFDVTFSGLNIVGDQATIDKYAALVNGGNTTDTPVEDDTPADDTPATDDKPAENTPAKPNTNTGAEGIAVAAGIAVLAAGAVVVAKKRN